MYNEGCEPVVKNCKFSGNYASVGGGMANYSGSKPVLDGCIFEDNIGTNGGGMYNDRSAPVVTRCVFSENQGEGAGMYNSGVGASPLVVNCVFADGVGAEVYNSAQYEDFNNVLVFTNCTFNRAGNIVMYNLFSAPTGTNCILWTGSAPAVQTYIRADASFRACDVNGCGGSGDWNGSFGRDGGGNIDADPVFVDETQPAGTFDAKWGTGDDGLRLQDSSPCIDTADGDAAPEKDIRGVQRYDEDGASGGTGEPDYVEIGAYEYHPVEVHFCGVTICDEPNIPWEWIKAFDFGDDGTYSNIKVGLGAYRDTETAIPDAVFHTLDSIAIRDGVTLTVWSKKDFHGDILLEQRGTSIIQNICYMGDTHTVDAMTKDFVEPLQSEFPQRVRRYSPEESGNMWYWSDGSFKIE